MIRLKHIVIAISTSLLVSCTTNKQFTCNFPSVNNQSTQSDTLDIVINIDGSGSMLGYVSDSNSRYVETLKILDNTLSISNLRSNTSIEYYRSSRPITRSDHRKAQLPLFYDESDKSKFPGVSVPIQEFITPPGENDTLLAIVTDLDQADGDVTILLKKIQQTYLNRDKPDYAMGVWAIKSEFVGKVYIQKPGELEDPFKFDGERPFYVIFVGRYQDINRYFNNLANNGLPDTSKLVIFSPTSMVKQVSYLDQEIDTLPPETQASLEPWRLKHKNVKLQKKDQNSQLWDISSGQTNNVNIRDSVNLHTVDFTLPLEVNSIIAKPDIKVFNRFSKDFVKSNEFLEDDSSLKSAMKLDQWNIGIDNTNKQGKLSFVSTIQPDKFPEPGIHLYTLDIVATRFQEQEWWNDWNWNASRDNPQDGSKTHNLLNFLRGLTTITNNIMKDNPPTIGRFCYAIQKN